MSNSVATWANIMTAAFLSSTLATFGATRAAAGDGVRQPGEKRDIIVYANDKEYASFPIIARGNQELVLLFQVQDLAKLRASGEHPHYQRLAVPRWAASRDGGLTWRDIAVPRLPATIDLT
ncbi:MAG: hypothetical protein ACKOFW_21915, partial [Planctomycetaceae bacterium]